MVIDSQRKEMNYARVQDCNEGGVIVVVIVGIARKILTVSALATDGFQLVGSLVFSYMQKHDYLT